MKHRPDINIGHLLNLLTYTFSTIKRQFQRCVSIFYTYIFIFNMVCVLTLDSNVHSFEKHSQTHKGL